MYLQVICLTEKNVKKCQGSSILCSDLVHFPTSNFFPKKTRSEKISQIFSKKAFLIFQGMELSGPKLLKT